MENELLREWPDCADGDATIKWKLIRGEEFSSCHVLIHEPRSRRSQRIHKFLTTERNGVKIYALCPSSALRLLLLIALRFLKLQVCFRTSSAYLIDKYYALVHGTATSLAGERLSSSLHSESFLLLLFLLSCKEVKQSCWYRTCHKQLKRKVSAPKQPQEKLLLRKFLATAKR